MGEYRLSSYSIFVNIENADDKWMLMHGYTGAIDIATSGIVSYIRSQKSLSAENAPFPKVTWDNLVARGYLTKAGVEDERAFVRRLANALHKKNKLFSGFMFIPTYDCNFRCPYCIENGVSDSGRKWSKRVFTREMVDKAYDALAEIAPHREFRSDLVYLYGGEPLLAENRDIVEYIVKKGREQGYQFRATTNGYDLEAFEDLLGPGLIRFLQITVDGDKEWHDKRRVHFKHGATFDKIMDNISLALRRGTGVGIRANTDKNNFGSLEQLREHFRRLGFYDYPNFSLHSGLLVSGGSDDRVPSLKAGNGKADTSTMEYFGVTEHRRQLKKTNMEDVRCPSEWLRTELSSAISNGKPVRLDTVSCSALSGFYIFDPYGDIYTCELVVGDKRHVVGSYSDPGKIKWVPGQLEKWHEMNIAHSDSCAKCRYVLLCRGGCPMQQRHYNPGNDSECINFNETLKIAVNKAYASYIQNK